MGSAERLITTALGASLLGFGLLRRGIPGVLAMGAGGVLAYHGLKRHSAIYELLGIGSEDATRWSHPLSRSVQSRASVTIDRPAAELYELWRDTPGLTRFHPHVTEIQDLGGGRSRWTVALPDGSTISYDAMITDQRRGQRIAWTTLPDEPVDLSGEISFARHPAGRGTIVRMELESQLPGGALGALLAMATDADPGRESSVALHRLKQWVETGEISTNRTPASRGDGWTHGSLHDARTSEGDRRREGIGAGRGNPDWTPREDEEEDDVEASADSHDQEHAPDDRDVAAASDDSFPASDPPSWTGSHAGAQVASAPASPRD